MGGFELSVVSSLRQSTEPAPALLATPIDLAFEERWDSWRARGRYRERAFRQSLERVAWAVVGLGSLALAAWETFR